MTSSRSRSNAGFTLVEMIIGLSLSLMIMGAVLSSYIFLGRNFTRSLGISSSNQPTLEAQGRRTLAYFTQDVRMTSGLDTTGSAPKVVPSASGVTLILPTTSGSKYVTYYFNGTASAVTLSSYTIPANSLVRIDLGTSTAQPLHSNLLSCTFSYYDSSNQPYTTYTDYLIGVKQVALSFSAQTGRAINGTLTQVYSSASPRLFIRNHTLLP